MNIRPIATLAATLMLTTTLASAQDLRIGLAEDPDILDPDQSRTFVGRIVYASVCDKLVDITPTLEIIPMLATGWTWSDDGMTLTMTLRDDVTFHDGEPFNAEAVAYNINRSKTLDESRRKSEVASISGTNVVDEFTIEIKLANPDATLLAQFADRSGMMVSPKAAEEMGLEFGAAPVCAGPYSFTERVQQDRIVLTKYADYYNADNFSFDSVTFLPITDDTVRLANLRAGDVDMIERLAATDAASVSADENLQMEQAVSLGYQGLTVNVGNGEKAGGPFGSDKLVRQALSMAIDREVINQVVFEGAFAAGNQPFPPTSPWYNADIPIPPRDVEGAKTLLAEAGIENPTVEIQVSTNPVAQQVVQVVQAMASEADITVSVVAKEFATLLSEQSAGNYEISQIGWSGRVDPDGNFHQFVTCEGGINDSKYCNPEIDDLLNAARTSNDLATRKESYDAALAIINEDKPLIYLYHQTWIWALSDSISGYTPYPDGMIRLTGVTKSE